MVLNTASHSTTKSAEAQAFLDTLDVSAIKLGTQRAIRLADALGNPQDAIPVIHVAGSNGKGSVVRMLAHILMAAGYRVGTFISPHLVDVRERIALQGQSIAEDDFVQAVLNLAQTLKAQSLSEQHGPQDDWPTYFEFLTVLAYHYFKQQAVDVAVVEVGLGGRLDATNIVSQPLASVITTISLEHTERLGNTLRAIATEKGGIIKPECPVVLGPSLPAEAIQTLEALATQRQAPVIYSQNGPLVAKGFNGPFQEIEDTRLQACYQLSLLGPYQRDNLATVLATLQTLEQAAGLYIPLQAVQQGLRQTRWPARFDYRPDEQLLIDGSHNAEGFESLKAGLLQYFDDRPLYWLLSLKKNRDPALLASLVKAFPNTRGVIISQGPKAAIYHPAECLAKQLHDDLQAALRAECPFGVQASIHTAEALDDLRNRLAQTPEALGVITGSLYTAGQVLTLLD